MKRRILDELEITEISGVDKPCQAGAVVTIMKRAPDATTALAARIKKLKARTVALNKAFDPDQQRAPDGKWSRAGSAIARAGRVVGRAALTAAPFAAAGGLLLLSEHLTQNGKPNYYSTRARLERERQQRGASSYAAFRNATRKPTSVPSIPFKKFWSAKSRAAALEARRRRQKAGQPKHRGWKALGLSAVASPVAGAAYLYATRNSRYSAAMRNVKKQLSLINK